MMRKTRKLKCVVTGRVLVATSEYYEKKIKQYSSEDELHRCYVCSEAKKLILKGHDVSQVRDKLQIKDDTLQDVPHDIIETILSKNNKKYMKAYNNITTASIINARTDPRLTDLINNLKNNE